MAPTTPMAGLYTLKPDTLAHVVACLHAADAVALLLSGSTCAQALRAANPELSTVEVDTVEQALQVECGGVWRLGDLDLSETEVGDVSRLAE
eukprot:6929081-Prymnesium_polylepis.1